MLALAVGTGSSCVFAFASCKYFVAIEVFIFFFRGRIYALLLYHRSFIQPIMFLSVSSPLIFTAREIEEFLFGFSIINPINNGAYDDFSFSNEELLFGFSI